MMSLPATLANRRIETAFDIQAHAAFFLVMPAVLIKRCPFTGTAYSAWWSVHSPFKTGRRVMAGIVGDPLP